MRQALGASSGCSKVVVATALGAALVCGCEAGALAELADLAPLAIVKRGADGLGLAAYPGGRRARDDLEGEEPTEDLDVLGQEHPWDVPVDDTDRDPVAPLGEELRVGHRPRSACAG